MVRGRAASCLLTLAVGVLGMLLAHVGGYRLAELSTATEPAHAHRHLGAPSAIPVVDALGHDHLLPVASGAFGIVLVAAFMTTVFARRRHRLGRMHLRHLLASQVVSFALLEVVERVAQDIPASTLLGRDALLALLLQVPVALGVLWLCRQVAAAVERLFEKRPCRHRRPAASRLPSGPHRPMVLHWALSGARRGPPVLLHVPT